MISTIDDFKELYFINKQDDTFRVCFHETCFQLSPKTEGHFKYFLHNVYRVIYFF